MIAGVRFLTASESARMVRCRKARIVSALHDGELKGMFDPVGRGGHGMWRVRQADLEAWIERRCRRPA